MSFAIIMGWGEVRVQLARDAVVKHNFHGAASALSSSRRRAGLDRCG
jgi:hypothetical protein